MNREMLALTGLSEQRKEMDRLPLASVSVVIPTKNRPDDLRIVVDGVLHQTVLPRQLIIVDQSTGTESETCVEEQVKHLSKADREAVEFRYIRDASISGLTAARNRGLAVVQAEIVLFLDDDVVVDDRFIEEILDAYRQFPAATGVSGIVVNYSPPSAGYRSWTGLFVRGSFHDDRQPVYWRSHSCTREGPIRVTRFGGGLMSFRMSAIRGIGFDENLTGACEGEDVDFCTRLGRRAALLIAPRARLVHKQTSIARSPQKHWLYLHARTNWYLYRRNWNRGPMNLACFVWLNVGYVVATSIVSLRRRSFQPWGLWLHAIQDSRLLVSGNYRRMLGRNSQLSGTA